MFLSIPSFSIHLLSFHSFTTINRDLSKLFTHLIIHRLASSAQHANQKPQILAQTIPTTDQERASSAMFINETSPTRISVACKQALPQSMVNQLMNVSTAQKYQLTQPIGKGTRKEPTLIIRRLMCQPHTAIEPQTMLLAFIVITNEQLNYSGSNQAFAYLCDLEFE